MVWRRTTSGDPRPTAPEATTDGGLDKHVTNEPNLAENVSLSQQAGVFTVTTNSRVGPTLDEPENEPNIEAQPPSLGVADSRNGKGVRGATGTDKAPCPSALGGGFATGEE